MLRSVKEQKRHRRTVLVISILLAAILLCIGGLAVGYLQMRKAYSEELAPAGDLLTVSEEADPLAGE